MKTFLVTLRDGTGYEVDEEYVKSTDVAGAIMNATLKRPSKDHYLFCRDNMSFASIPNVCKFSFRHDVFPRARMVVRFE